ncbi:L-fucose operon activator [Cronobacter sakazakii]|nr:L-fucose operon activator [Cronobacter sakazakii]
MKNERQQKIIRLLWAHEALSTQALAHRLAVSQETIRRDLSELQRAGKILRSHGRARALRRDVQSHDDPFQARMKSHHAHKMDIARNALNWLDAGMVVALDASTTCWYLARQLPDIPLTIFTNSVRVGQEVARREQITLISTGGILHRQAACYENPSLPALLKHIDIDLFLFSCQGIDEAGTIWDARSWNAEYKTLLLRRAAQSLLLIDRSKRNRTGDVQIGTLDQVTEVITQEENGGQNAGALLVV